MQEASRLKPIPKELGLLVELVGAIPAGQQLPDITNALEMELKRRVDDFGESEEYAWNFAADGALAICLNGLPEAIRNYVVGYPEITNRQGLNTARYEEMLGRYFDLQNAYNGLRAAARWHTALPHEKIAITRLLRSMGIYIDEQGQFRSAKNLFEESVIGVDIDRVRECKVCQRVFWAGRKDQWCCNPRCADISRKREKRKKDATGKQKETIRRSKNEAYKERRAAKQRERKAIKKGR